MFLNIMLVDVSLVEKGPGIDMKMCPSLGLYAKSLVTTIYRPYLKLICL